MSKIEVVSWIFFPRDYSKTDLFIGLVIYVARIVFELVLRNFSRSIRGGAHIFCYIVVVLFICVHLRFSVFQGMCQMQPIILYG
jgi:hypothetical protein